jgi:hypothetical protein
VEPLITGTHLQVKRPVVHLTVQLLTEQQLLQLFLSILMYLKENESITCNTGNEIISGVSTVHSDPLVEHDITYSSEDDVDLRTTSENDSLQFTNNNVRFPLASTENTLLTGAIVVNNSPCHRRR